MPDLETFWDALQPTSLCLSHYARFTRVRGVSCDPKISFHMTFIGHCKTYIVTKKSNQ